MKNFFLKLGVCALALTGAAEVLAQEQVIQLFAHRGSRFEYDENTLPAFKASYDAGLRGFETDIRMTRDGELVISHDETLARLTPCKRVVETMTADEIRKVKTNQGNDLIFLPELVDFFADKDNVYIEFEMKTKPVESYPEERLREYCEKVYNTVMAKKPANSLYLFTSSDKRALKMMRSLHPDVDLLLIISEADLRGDDPRSDRHGHQAVGLPHRRHVEGDGRSGAQGRTLCLAVARSVARRVHAGAIWVPMRSTATVRSRSELARTRTRRGSSINNVRSVAGPVRRATCIRDVRTSPIALHYPRRKCFRRGYSNCGSPDPFAGACAAAFPASGNEFPYRSTGGTAAGTARTGAGRCGGAAGRLFASDTFAPFLLHLPVVLFPPSVCDRFRSSH